MNLVTLLKPKPKAVAEVSRGEAEGRAGLGCGDKTPIWPNASVAYKCTHIKLQQWCTLFLYVRGFTKAKLKLKMNNIGFVVSGSQQF